MPTATADLTFQATENAVVEYVQIQIGEKKPGALLFQVHLLLNGPFVTGVGRITQAGNPPLDIRTFPTGRTSLIASGGAVTRIIQLTGHELPTPTMPPNPINVRLCDIILNGAEGVQGKATYHYIEGKWLDGKWLSAEGPVIAVWSKAGI